MRVLTQSMTVSFLGVPFQWLGVCLVLVLVGAPVNTCVRARRN